MADDSKRRSQNAYDLLRGDILGGALLPGERLRAADLRARYGLGLTPIREALMRLSSEGLVESESHRGARVRETTPRDLADLMRARREIERLCLTRAIAHGDAVWEAEILRAMHLLSRAELPASPEARRVAEEWEVRHRQFHFALVAACGSDWLLHFWNTLADHSERYRSLRLLHHKVPAADVRDLNAEHERIMDAVLARDADRATALMDEHLSKTEQAVARLLELGPGPAPGPGPG
ncbi:MAG: FCD domain-containing protein [Azospirillaceae bacterium]